MFELRQTYGSLEFVHLAVDARRNDRDFIRKAEVLQIVDAFLGFFVRANDGAALESGEHLGGVEAENGQVAMTQDAAAFIFDGEGVRGVIDHLQAVGVGNLLDARGVISVVERASFIARVRALAKACCETYLKNLPM